MTTLFIQYQFLFLNRYKNIELAIVALNRKPTPFDRKNACLGPLYYFYVAYCIYTLKCIFQSVGRFIAVRLIILLFF